MSPTLEPVEQHCTDTGVMIPLYRDWDEWHAGHKVHMVYTTSIAAGKSKGPILHRVGTQLLTAIAGTVHIRYISHENLMNDGEWFETLLRDTNNSNQQLIHIPPMTWYELWAYDVPDDGVVLNMPNLVWRPDYSDQVKATSWDNAKKAIV